MFFRTAVMSVALVATLALGGCTTLENSGPPVPVIRPNAADYAAMKDGKYELPAIPIHKIPEKYWRQTVNYKTSEPVGTIVVDTPHRFLYLVEPHGKAIRYGIGVGKAGFAWKGDAYIAWKQPWPKWTPPDDMIERTPSLKRYGGKHGMPGGLKNPLGARAMYLFSPAGKDTLYRIHGNPEWQSIGHAVSSGCIRMMNQDVIDLYNRVGVGRQQKVVVKQAD